MQGAPGRESGPGFSSGAGEGAPAEREPAAIRRSALRESLLLGALFLALAGSGIGFGLPRRAIDRDEKLVVETAVATMSDPCPINLRYPTAFITIFRWALEPYAWWVAATTHEPPFPRLVAELAVHMNPYYALGRSLATIAGILTVVATAALGRRLIGARCGWIAGAIVACTPVFVEHARQAKVDVPLAMWTALALLLALRACDSGRLRTALAAAVCVGFAAGTKWSAAPLWLTLALVARGTLARGLSEARDEIAPANDARSAAARREISRGGGGSSASFSCGAWRSRCF